MGAAYARPMAASAGYRGTIALHDAVIPAPISATALAITCWDDSFAMHGIQSLPTPPPPHPLGIGEIEITTDTGSTHHGSGGGGHGHPRFLWDTRFRPALPTGVTTLALSAKAMTDGATVTALIRLPHGPPAASIVRRNQDGQQYKTVSTRRTSAMTPRSAPSATTRSGRSEPPRSMLGLAREGNVVTRQAASCGVGGPCGRRISAVTVAPSVMALADSANVVTPVGSAGRNRVSHRKRGCP